MLRLLGSLEQGFKKFFHNFFMKGAQGFKFRGQLIKGFWQFWTDFFDIGTIGIVRDSQNDSGGQTTKFCSFRGSNGVKWGSTGGND